MSNDNPIQVGGAYVENEDFVPNPLDQVAQFNTSGTGAHQKLEEVSPVFAVDKVKTAQEIQAALDPKNTSVDRSKVITATPDLVVSEDNGLDDLQERAAAVIDQGVTIGGPTPAQVEAEKDGNEGVESAVEQERQNSASNSVGGTSAGIHTERTMGQGDAEKGALPDADDHGQGPVASDDSDKAEGSESDSGDKSGDDLGDDEKNSLKANATADPAAGTTPAKKTTAKRTASGK